MIHNCLNMAQNYAIKVKKTDKGKKMASTVHTIDDVARKALRVSPHKPKLHLARKSQRKHKKYPEESLSAVKTTFLGMTSHRFPLDSLDSKKERRQDHSPSDQDDIR